MAGPGKPKKAEKIAENVTVAVHGTEQTQTVSETKPTEKAPEMAREEIASHTCWRYHPILEPRLFNKGEVIPAGWQDEDMIGWTMNGEGRWRKK